MLVIATVTYGCHAGCVDRTLLIDRLKLSLIPIIFTYLIVYTDQKQELI